MTRCNATTRLAGAVLVLCSFMAPVSASAAGDVFDQFFRYTERDTQALFQEMPGETVDPFTGILHIVQEDLVLPGKAGLDLRILRSYNSKIWGRSDLLDLEPFLAEKEHSVLGYGWSFHMGRLKNPLGSGQSGSCGGDFPVYEAPDGTTHVFYPISGGTTFVSKDYWRMERNCAALSGAGACVWSNTGIRYELSSSNQFWMGTVPVWPTSGIVDLFGNRITVDYVQNQGDSVNSIVDTYGRTVFFVYDSGTDGRRLTSMSFNGKSYTYDYTNYSTFAGARRFLTAVTPPVGSGHTYTYATGVPVAQNLYALASITYPSGGTTTYNYGAVNFFTGRETVPFSVVTQRTVGGRGVTSGTWSYSYTSPGPGNSMHVTTIGRPDGKQDTYTIYGFGYVAGKNATGYTWLVGLTQELARANRAEVEVLTWNASSTPASAATYSAPVYSGNCGPYLVYDTSTYSATLARRQIARDGSTYSTDYSDFDAYGQPRTVTETGQQSRTTIWTFFYAPDANLVRGRPLTQLVCVGGSCFNNAWTYNATTYARESENMSGVLTSFGYDQYGNLASVTNVLNQKLALGGYETGHGTPTNFDFNGAFTISRTTSWEGWVLSETDGRGDTTHYDYDSIGRLLRVTLPGNSSDTTYTYAGDGSQMRLTRGAYSRTSNLDGLGRVAFTSDSEGVLTSTHYDSMGRKWFTSYPYNTAIGEVGEETQYDGLGRATQRTKGHTPGGGTCDALRGCTAYAYSQNCVSTTIQRAVSDTTTTTQCNASFGDPNEQRLVRFTDANSRSWRYSYTAHGEVQSVSAPLTQGNRRYDYDSGQHLVSMATGESGVTSYGRNAIGQMTSRTDARATTITYAYDDPLGRLRQVTYQGQSPDNATRSYDDANNVTHVASVNGGSFDYAYDEINRITRQDWTFGGRTYTTLYHYDMAGCLDSMTYPTGTVVAMTCDGANRVASISVGGSTIVNGVTYHPSGQIQQMTYGNGVTTAVTYDTRARVTRIAAGTTIDLVYGYDGADNVTLFNNAAVANANRTMTYDKVDQLATSVATGLWGAAFSQYDELGNRIVHSPDGNGTINYTYDAQNRLATATGPSSTLPTPMMLNWDLAGRLATSSDGASYRYDGQNRRVQKVEPTGTTLYHYDIAGHVIAETNSIGMKLRDFLYVGSKLVAVDGCITRAPPAACTERQWYHTDALGSVVAHTDSTRSPSRIEYQAWGETWVASATGGNRLYNGRGFDPGTGLYDYGARMYWPQLGRFISADLAEALPNNPMSFNRFGYVYNNPYKYTDPNGRVPFLLVTAGIGAVGGALWGMYSSYQDEGHIDWSTVGRDALIGGGIGLGGGAGVAWLLTGTATASAGAVGTGALTLLGMGGAAADQFSRSQERNLETIENIIEHNAKPSDFSGVASELAGKLISKPGGGFWDHITEMNQSIVGLEKAVRGLQGSLQNPNLSPVVRGELEVGIERAQEMIDKMRAALGGGG